MDPKIFQSNAPGKLVTITGDEKNAFIPAELPPDLTLNKKIILALEEANHQLGSLNGIGKGLQHPRLLILPFMRREAILSSKIEGTVASLTDLVLFEADPSKERGDAREVQNYIAALRYGLKQVSSIPLGRRLMCEMHEHLMNGITGDRYGRPAAMRTNQVYVGHRVDRQVSARFVPPPASYITKLISNLEAFINEEAPTMPLLVKIALIHYQFETIQPFYDGNGRIGRLLIMLILGIQGRLTQPLLYPSAFFSANKNEYYDRLLRVSTHAAWDAWILFFLRAISETSKDAVVRAQEIVDMHRAYRKKLIKQKAGDTAQRLLDILFRSPAFSIPAAQALLKLTYPTVQKGADKLIQAGIVAPVPGTSHPKIYASQPIIEAIERDLSRPRPRVKS